VRNNRHLNIYPNKWHLVKWRFKYNLATSPKTDIQNDAHLGQIKVGKTLTVNKLSMAARRDWYQM